MTRTRLAFLIASLSLIWARPAAADLILSFDQSTYTIAGVGDTTVVTVLLSQTASGVQVGVGNELISAGIDLSFATAGAAAVLSTADVAAGSAWDAGGPPIFATNGTDTVISLGLVSLAGIADLSSPVVLGTFVFTGQSVGSTSTSVVTLAPGSSFITAQGDILDPANPASARITVDSSTVIPEPSSLALASISGLFTAAMAFRRRFRTAC